MDDDSNDIKISIIHLVPKPMEVDEGDKCKRKILQASGYQSLDFNVKIY